jgi:hypothetical protein
VDADYTKKLVETEKAEMAAVQEGRGPPIAKNPELSAQLAYLGFGVLTVAGVSNYFTNTPTNRLWQAKQDAAKAAKAKEAKVAAKK